MQPTPKCSLLKMGFIKVRSFFRAIAPSWRKSKKNVSVLLLLLFHVPETQFCFRLRHALAKSTKAIALIFSALIINMQYAMQMRTKLCKIFSKPVEPGSNPLCT